MKAISKSSYSLADYTPGKADYLIVVSKGSAPCDALSTVKLMYYRHFDHKAYIDNASRTVRFTPVKL